MKITYEAYGYRYAAEYKPDDFTAPELKQLFSRLLVASGFSPTILDTEDEGGKYQWVGENEVIIDKEKLEGVSNGRG